ncbi:MAG TPA: hypothetical protein VG345_15115, partial [Bryobacteraceae bacterium]|nr:hypothetical protein [Bryobacteraceae bacterium]
MNAEPELANPFTDMLDLLSGRVRPHGNDHLCNSPGRQTKNPLYRVGWFSEKLLKIRPNQRHYGVGYQNRKKLKLDRWQVIEKITIPSKSDLASSGLPWRLQGRDHGICYLACGAGPTEVWCSNASSRQ